MRARTTIWTAGVLVAAVSGLLLVSGCVPNKKIVYLQKDDLHKKNLPLDTVVRVHNLSIQEYRIQPLDILAIRIESLTDDEFDFVSKLYPNVQQQGAGGGNAANQLINSFLVDDNGDIEFPVAGKIHLAGLSLFQATTKLQDAFKAFLKDCVVRVRLQNFRFTVLGEVKLENQIVSLNSRVTIMEAIGLAGGLTDLADRSKVKLVRQRGAQTEVVYLDLLDEHIVESEYFYMQQNDLIVVPALKQRPYRKYWLENVTLIISTLTLVLLTVTLVQK